MSMLTPVSHHLCPYVQRAAIALSEKGIGFKRVSVDLGEKPNWFITIAPLGKVPLLRVRQSAGSEAVLFESAAIYEYIDETPVGPKLHPADPLARAQHHAWVEFGSAILADLWGLETPQEPGVYEAKRRAIAEKFIRLETTLGPGPYFAGERFSLVDAVFAPIFRYFDVFDMIADAGVFADTPKVRAWRAAPAERSSVRDAVELNYPERPDAFLVRHDTHLLKFAA